MKINSKNILLLIFLSLLLLPTFIVCTCIGPVYIPVKYIIKIIIIGLLHNSKNLNNPLSEYYDIIWNIRLPRVITGFIAGACLSISGLLLQILFRNPIVGPWVLGVESGSTLAVGLLVLAGTLIVPGGITNPWTLFLTSLIGALAVMMIVLSIAGIVRSIVTLLLIGVMIGYMCSAVLNILEVFARNIQLHAFIIWSLGSLGYVTWSQLFVICVISIPCMLLTLLISKSLNAYILGEEYAKTLGVNIKIVRILVILLSSILTAIITAFTGPIAFIGLAIPHIARMIFKTSDSRVLIPASAIIGALITSYCDLAARTLIIPVELPISTVTSLIGAPIVITLLMRYRR